MQNTDGGWFMHINRLFVLDFSINEFSINEFDTIVRSIIHGRFRTAPAIRAGRSCKSARSCGGAGIVSLQILGA